MSTAVSITNLSYSYGPLKVLNNLNLTLHSGSRCILVGSNGAGKSTLLRLIGGKHLILPENSIITLDNHAFRNDLDIVFLGNNWSRVVAFAGSSVNFQGDIGVFEMTKDLSKLYPERSEYLYKLLDINPLWRMHEVSDGQRRRVQLLCGLIRPFKLLCLDEITVDLDVVTRSNFLNFLREESDVRKATIIYCTHIFDGLTDWSTHVAYLSGGKLKKFGEVSQFVKKDDDKKDSFYENPLLETVANWIKEDSNVTYTKFYKE